jgi:hypothetical protein
VFPDGDEAPDAWKHRREGLADALSKMRAIASALQWKLPLRLIQAYAQELKGIQPLVANETHLVLLLNIQSELCRHMLDRRRQISPQALMLLLKGFSLMERLALDRGLPAARRRELVAPLVRAHLAFRRSLEPQRGAAAGRATAAEGLPAGGRRYRRPAAPTRPPAGGLERRAYYLIPVDHLAELRRLIQAGFEELGILMSQRKDGR